MLTYNFYAVERDSSRYKYPVQLSIKAPSKAEAVNRIAVENEMKVTELGPHYVWLKTTDGVDLKYTVTQEIDDTGMFDA